MRRLHSFSCNFSLIAVILLSSSLTAWAFASLYPPYHDHHHDFDHFHYYDGPFVHEYSSQTPFLRQRFGVPISPTVPGKKPVQNSDSASSQNDNGNTNMKPTMTGPGQTMGIVPAQGTIMPPIITGPQNPSSHDENSMLLEVLYDMYEHGVPPDYGWVYPPSPPPTMDPHEHPQSTTMTYKPFKPFKPPSHGKPVYPKPVTGMVSSSESDDEDFSKVTEKTPYPPMSIWRPLMMGMGLSGVGTAALTPKWTSIPINKLIRLKKKWNRFLEKLKIPEHYMGPSTISDNDKDVETVNRRPIKMSGIRNKPQASSSFPLEQLPGWNAPPLRNPKRMAKDKISDQKRLGSSSAEASFT